MKERVALGLVSRNVTIKGKRTSIRLERQMWGALHDIAYRERCTIHDICSLVASNKEKNLSLTANIRIFLMIYYKAAATEEGHAKSGHGNFMKMMNRGREAGRSICCPVNQNEELRDKAIKDIESEKIREPYYG